MNPVKKLLLIVLSVLLITACKKEKFESTGTLDLNFKNGIPSWYIIYTEDGYSTTHLPIISFPSGSSIQGVNIKANGNTLTIEGLNYGTYILSTSSTGFNVIQVAAGTSKTYNL